MKMTPAMTGSATPGKLICHPPLNREKIIHPYFLTQYFDGRANSSSLVSRSKYGTAHPSKDLPPNENPAPEEKQPEHVVPPPEFYPTPNHPQIRPVEKEEPDIQRIGQLRYAFKGKSLWVLVLLMCFSSILYSQQASGGPHQGRVKSAGLFMIEVLGCSDHFEIYVLDKSLQAVSNVGLTGKVQFFSGKRTQIALLVPYGRDGFSAKLPGDDNYASYSIEITTSEGLIQAEFSNECPKTY